MSEIPLCRGGGGGSNRGAERADMHRLRGICCCLARVARGHFDGHLLDAIPTLSHIMY